MKKNFFPFGKIPLVPYVFHNWCLKLHNHMDTHSVLSCMIQLGSFIRVKLGKFHDRMTIANYMGPEVHGVLLPEVRSLP